MSDGGSKNVFSLVHIDTKGLGEAGKAFVEVARDAISGYARPWQIRRVADAEADAKEIAAMSEIRVTGLHKRAAERWFNEEAQKQANMEAITAAAAPLIADNAQPNKMERDWLVNFYDKSRLTSDEEMQQLWAKILAGEANAPGKFSKRTVNVAASLEKADAEAFQSLCRFVWKGIGPHEATPIIDSPALPLFVEHGVTHRSVLRLTEAGLTTYDTSLFFGRGSRAAQWFGPVIRTEYGGQFFAVYPAEGHRPKLGRVGFTKAGADLFPLCSASPVDEFRNLVLENWIKESAKVQRFELGESLPETIRDGAPAV